MKKLFVLIIHLLLIYSGTFASHIVGGELGVEQKQGYNRRFYLNLYFDDINGEAGAKDSEIIISLFRKKDNERLADYGLPLISTTAVSYSNPACALSSGALKTSLLVYEKLINLDPSIYSDPEGYYVSWQRCCRNKVISNIQTPGEVGMVFYAEFPPVRYQGSDFKNSSPVMNPVKGDYLCARQQYAYSFGATDPDGDRLVYSLITPMQGTATQSNIAPIGNPGPYQSISWGSGFTNNPIPGNPGLQVNAQTGLVTVTPDMLGLYVFTIRCEEFRNNRKIGEIRRDFQWKVIDCGSNNEPKLSLELPDGSLYQLNDTLIITSAADACFKLLALDDLNERLNFKITPLDFTEPMLTLSNAGAVIVKQGEPVQSTFCWPDCSINRELPYTFEVEVEDNGCPMPLMDKFIVKVIVRPNPNDPPVISTTLSPPTVNLAIGDSVLFNVTGTDTTEDVIVLSFEGIDFDPSSLGMQFSGGSGQGTITSPFYWKPDCRILSLPQPLEVKFTIRDNSCFSQNFDTTTVFFYLTDRDNKEADFLPANVFTPNSDGVNDTFYFPDLPLDNCAGQFNHVKVFNRWGQKVFEGETRAAAWDGANVPAGVYFFLVTFSNKVYKGSVTVLK